MDWKEKKGVQKNGSMGINPSLRQKKPNKKVPNFLGTLMRNGRDSNPRPPA
jgi:hypothetical protein